jgi:hypothetical protein
MYLSENTGGGHLPPWSLVAILWNLPDLTLHAATTPVPSGFQVSVSQSNTADTPYLTIRWDPAFNEMYGIESYLIEASGGFIDCPQTCASNGSSPCQCTGLIARMDGNISIIATTCGDQQGLPAVIYLTPRGKFFTTVTWPIICFVVLVHTIVEKCTYKLLEIITL